MREIVATITSKGQITLPVEVRRHLGVSVHDKVAFVIDDEGTVRVQPASYPTLESLIGAAGTLPQPLSWEEMREIAREDALESKYRSGR